MVGTESEEKEIAEGGLGCTGKETEVSSERLRGYRSTVGGRILGNSYGTRSGPSVQV